LVAGCNEPALPLRRQTVNCDATLLSRFRSARALGTYTIGDHFE
jgi:hypothetical protein